MYGALLHHCDNDKCPQTLPDVLGRGGAKASLVENHLSSLREVVRSTDVPLLASLRPYSQCLAQVFKSVQWKNSLTYLEFY